MVEKNESIDYKKLTISELRAHSAHCSGYIFEKGKYSKRCPVCEEYNDRFDIPKKIEKIVINVLDDRVKVNDKLK